MGSSQGSAAASPSHGRGAGSHGGGPPAGEWGSIAEGSVIHLAEALKNNNGDGTTLELYPGQRGKVKKLDERSGEWLVDWDGHGEHWLLTTQFKLISVDEEIDQAELRDASRPEETGLDVTLEVNELISENGVHDITRKGPLSGVAKWGDFPGGPLELRVSKDRCTRVYSDNKGDGGGPPFDLRALLRQAAALKLEALEAPPCPAATVETGFAGTTGVYRPSGQWKNGHPVYRGPRHAELRYEVRNNGEGPNWAAGKFVGKDCWTILYEEHGEQHHQYAVPCSGSIRLLPTIEGAWSVRHKGTLPVKVTCHDVPTEHEQHEFLDLAKGARFQEVRRLVLENPAYVNVQPGGRWSALHQAANKGLRDDVQFLLGQGASRALLTKEGNTPLDVALDECRDLLAEPVGQPAGEVQTPTSAGGGAGAGPAEDAEALEALKQVAPKRSRAQLFGFFRRCGGDVDLTVEALLAKDIPSLRDEPEKWFRHFDLNDDGSLEEREAIDAIVYTFRVDRAEAENYIRMVWSSPNIDGDQDGVIQMEEFMAEDGLKDAILDKWVGESGDDVFEDCEDGEGESTTRASSEGLPHGSSEAELRWQPLTSRTASTSKGELLLAEALDKLHEKGAIAVYFAAVIPALPDDFDLLVRERYKAYRREGLDFQVLLIPVDSTEQASKSHDAQQWLTVPFADAASRKALAKRFEVHSVPQIILLGKDGSVLAEDGRRVLRDDPTGLKFPWTRYRTRRPSGEQGRKFFRMSSLVDPVKGMVRSMVAKPPEVEAMDEKSKEERARHVLLDEAGYQEVGRLNSNWAMTQFTLRIVAVKQWDIKDRGKLHSLMWEHSGMDKTQSLKQLLADLEAAPWIEKPFVEGVASNDAMSPAGSTPSAPPPPTHSIRHNYIAVPTESQRVATPGPPLASLGPRSHSALPGGLPPPSLPPTSTIGPKKPDEEPGAGVSKPAGEEAAGEEVAAMQGGPTESKSEEQTGEEGAPDPPLDGAVVDGQGAEAAVEQAAPSTQVRPEEGTPASVSEDAAPKGGTPGLAGGGQVEPSPPPGGGGAAAAGQGPPREAGASAAPAGQGKGPGKGKRPAPGPPPPPKTTMATPGPSPPPPESKAPSESEAKPPGLPPKAAAAAAEEENAGGGSAAGGAGRGAISKGKSKGPPPPTTVKGGSKGPPAPTGGKGPPAPTKGAGKGPPPPGGKAPPLPKAATRAGPTNYRNARVMPTREEIDGWTTKETNPLRWPRLLQGDILLRESLFEDATLVEVDCESLAHCFEKVKADRRKSAAATVAAAAKKSKPILWDATETKSPADRRQMVFIQMKAWRQYFDTFLERLEKLELLQIAHGDFKEDVNRQDQFMKLMDLVDEMDGTEQWKKLSEEGAELKWEWQDDIEGLLQRLSRVKNFRERLEAIRLGVRGEKDLESLTADCEVLQHGVQAVFKASELKNVFLMLLSIGNHLNAGNTKFGRADGFDTLTLLESTGYLADYKGPEPEKKTLLEYLRDQLTPEAEEDCRALSMALQEISWRPPRPGEKEEPDPIAMNELKRRSTAISKDFSSIKRMIEKAIALRKKEEGSVNPQELKVFEVGNRLLDCHIARCQEAETRVGELEFELERLHKYLAHKPSKNVAVSANRTLGILANFLQRLVPKGGSRRSSMRRQGSASSDGTVDLAEGQA